MVDNINHKPTFLTNAVFQALRLMLSFKKVDIVLSKQRRDSVAAITDTRTRDYARPQSFNDRTRLEFKPREIPRNWERNTMSPQMRLPGHIRRTMILYVIGVDSIVYPTDTLAGYPLRMPTWRVVPRIRRANPNRELSLLHTCQKLWEESWRVVLRHN